MDLTFWKRRIFYLPRLFTWKEKILIAFLAVIFFTSFSYLITKFVAKNTTPAPARGGVFREGVLKQPRLVNPIFLTSNDTDRDLVNLIFSGLIRYDDNGEPIPDLAKKWEISEDGKTYTFFLNESARWHDGQKLTAEDIVFTIKTIQNPEIKSPLRADWQGVTAEKIDDLTVRLSLKQPYAPFLENATLFIIPKHVWEATLPQAYSISEFNLKPIGSGKYRFSNYESGGDEIKSYALDLNKKYYGKVPNISEIVFLTYSSEKEIIDGYKKNEIDSMGAVSLKKMRELEKEDLVINTLRFPRVYGIFLNPNKFPEFGKDEIREALNISLDRDALIEKAVGGTAVPLDSPIPPGTSGYISGKQGGETIYDIEKAASLLEKNGWKKNEKGAAVKTTAKGKEKTETQFSFELLTSDSEELVATAEFIKQAWRELGIDTRINVMKIADLETQAIRSRNYDTLLFGEILRRDPDPFAFWHSSQIRDPGLNIALFSNKRADQLLEETRRENDPDKRKEKYAEFQNIVRKNNGAIFLFSPNYIYGMRGSIQGFETTSVTTPADRFNTVENWYIKTKREWKK